MTFKPMYDLEHLTEAQREEYYLSACEYFHVPPELNLLAFIWLDSNDGKRNLVLYAKKGATDMMRDNFEITTTKVTKDAGPGYVAWIVEGKNRQGRVEMAVGSASIEGLKGQALSNAVMIAHTRATRRMTLQFVGGGLLDESELPSTVSDINRSGASLASLATLAAPVQPSVQPNVDPGKDVTSQPNVFVEKKTRRDENGQLNPNSPIEFIAPVAFSSGDITPAAVETVEQIAAPAEKKRRGRPRRSEIVLDALSPDNNPAKVSEFDPSSSNPRVDVMYNEYSTPQMNIPTAKSAENALEVVASRMPPSAAFQTPIPDATKPFTPEQFDAAAAEMGKAAVDFMLDMPSEAEEKAWRARLFVYTNDILPKGGMAKADGIIWKIRKYVQAMFPDLPVKNGTVKLNNTQWKTLMNILDNITAVSNPEGLVKVIEEVAAKS